MKPLVRRQKAVKATMERFRGKAFAFGSVDCVKMVAFHLRQLGRKVHLSKGGQYKTLRGAQGALNRAGYANVVEAVDGQGLERITLAFALPGDIVSFAADHDMGALGIVVGNGDMMAFHEAHEQPVIMTMNAIDVCWSALP